MLTTVTTPAALHPVQPRASVPPRSPRAPAGGAARASLTFAVRLGTQVAAHKAGRAVRGGRGARRRAGGGGQALVRSGVVQGPVAGERRGWRLILIQAAPQPRRLQAERAHGRRPWARVQRRAQPVQRAPAAVGHLREGQPLTAIPPPRFPEGWAPGSPGKLHGSL